MKWLDPKSIRPPHGVCNDLKSVILFRRFQSNGWEGRPLVVIRLRSSKRWKYYSITGSHRIAAARKAGIKVPVIVLPSSFYDDIKRNYLVFKDGHIFYCDVYDDAWRFTKGLKPILNWNKYKLAAQVLSEENYEIKNWLFKDVKEMVVGVKEMNNTREYGVRYKLLLDGRRSVIISSNMFRTIFPFIKKYCKEIKNEN